MNQNNIPFFASIPGFPDYLVAIDGGVFSTKYGKIRKLKVNVTDFGYHNVVLYSGKKRSIKLVHRLVMLAFSGASDLQVNHRDGNKTNNNRANLEYCTAKENTAHARTTGLNQNSGTKHFRAKLNAREVQAIRLLRGMLSHREIAKMFGVTHTVVGQIHRGKLWTSLVYSVMT